MINQSSAIPALTEGVKSKILVITVSPLVNIDFSMYFSKDPRLKLTDTEGWSFSACRQVHQDLKKKGNNQSSKSSNQISFLLCSERAHCCAGRL